MKRVIMIFAVFILVAIFNTFVYAGEEYQMIMNGAQSALALE
ncbi:hypothetical protein M972_112106 [Acetivibrio thermocellus AD2]|jgi:hypothetical protein|uniref:Uncharacterized protein n=1 Tax=Acetivibrio thermocellus AD2 TaxID=1138384 RepID=A0AB36THI6_ACETH|nr:hypothetical protein [Acetivibrio thermocellus]ADU75055.1 hypothetical protein Clo1313_2011 [Acetivibrio thermocellus DSM 1313]ALX09030.1 hypothetical protein AD2_02040 [Acetivibrio thermocellus AD2]ANV76779.1 hypothetical protein LQRI_2038 [Acetivibrio thermocellus DSM 2360]EIC04930.1 hypothetical protein YSBL_1329 [Acetivibrio thermocellus YS]PFH03303.1 hypothetical protein M972_112106 [Acetivibrio thermocellus AD2]